MTDNQRVSLVLSSQVKGEEVRQITLHSMFRLDKWGQSWMLFS